MSDFIKSVTSDPTFQISNNELEKIQKAASINYQITAINYRDETSIRESQKLLADIEVRITYLIGLQHKAKRIVHTCKTVERQLIQELRNNETLKEKATKLQREQILYTVVPDFVDLYSKWVLVEELCTLSLKRLSDLKGTLKLQKDLDDNWRWAQRSTT
jgi:hypothetical protein